MSSNLIGPAILLGGSDESLAGGEKTKFDELSKHQIEGLITKLSQIRKKKFKRSKENKYGNINRGFTDKELITFFKYCSNRKAYLAFFLMANLGLRVGEVVKIKLEDLDFVKNKIRISTEKAHTGDFLYLHTKVRKLLFLWVQNFQDEIVKHENYVLYSDNKKLFPHNHISSNWLRQEFRKVAYLSDLNEHYDYADDQENAIAKRNGVSRKLYRLTTHSLRHYYITHVYNESRNPIHTKKLARHRDFKSTQVYIHSSQEDIDSTMKKVFESEGVEADDTEIEDFAKMYKIWRSMKNEH